MAQSFLDARQRHRGVAEHPGFASQQLRPGPRFGCVPAAPRQQDRQATAAQFGRLVKNPPEQITPLPQRQIFIVEKPIHAKQQHRRGARRQARRGLRHVVLLAHGVATLRHAAPDLPASDRTAPDRPRLLARRERPQQLFDRSEQLVARIGTAHEHASQNDLGHEPPLPRQRRQTVGVEGVAPIEAIKPPSALDPWKEGRDRPPDLRTRQDDRSQGPGRIPPGADPTSATAAPGPASVCTKKLAVQLFSLPDQRTDHIRRKYENQGENESENEAPADPVSKPVPGITTQRMRMLFAQNFSRKDAKTQRRGRNLPASNPRSFVLDEPISQKTSERVLCAFAALREISFLRGILWPCARQFFEIE